MCWLKVSNIYEQLMGIRSVGHVQLSSAHLTRVFRSRNVFPSWTSEDCTNRADIHIHTLYIYVHILLYISVIVYLWLQTPKPWWSRTPTLLSIWSWDRLHVAGMVVMWLSTLQRVLGPITRCWHGCTIPGHDHHDYM